MFSHYLSPDQISKLLTQRLDPPKPQDDKSPLFLQPELKISTKGLSIRDFLQKQLAKMPQAGLYLFCPSPLGAGYARYCVDQAIIPDAKIYVKEVFLRLTPDSRNIFLSYLEQNLQLNSNYLVVLCDYFQFFSAEKKSIYATCLFEQLQATSLSVQSAQSIYAIIPEFFNYLSNKQQKFLINFLIEKTQTKANLPNANLVIIYTQLGALYPKSDAFNQNIILKFLSKSKENQKIIEYVILSLNAMVPHLAEAQLQNIYAFLIDLFEKELERTAGLFWSTPSTTSFVNTTLTLLCNITILIKLQSNNDDLFKPLLEKLQQRVSTMWFHYSSADFIKSSLSKLGIRLKDTYWAFFTPEKKATSLKHVITYLSEPLYLKIAVTYFIEATQNGKDAIRSGIINQLRDAELESQKTAIIPALIKIYEYDSKLGQQEILLAILKKNLCFDNPAFNSIFFSLSEDEQDHIGTLYLSRYTEFLHDKKNPLTKSMHINRELYFLINFDLRMNFILSNLPKEEVNSKAITHLLAAANDEVNDWIIQLNIILVVPDLSYIVRDYLISDLIFATSKGVVRTSALNLGTSGDYKEQPASAVPSTVPAASFINHNAAPRLFSNPTTIGSPTLLAINNIDNKAVAPNLI